MKPFKKNDYPTLGIEEELHLINPETAELTPSVNEVMALLDNEFRERVCYELLQCILEIRTGVYKTVEDLIQETLTVELSWQRDVRNSMLTLLLPEAIHSPIGKNNLSVSRKKL